MLIACRYGRYVGIVTMLTGVFFLAMPLTIVGTSFNAAWEELEHSKHEVEEEENKNARKKVHVKLAEHANDFRHKWNRFAQAFAEKSSVEDKQVLCRESFPELREIQSDLSEELINVFEIFKLSINDLNIVKEIDALKEGFETQEQESPDQASE